MLFLGVLPAAILFCRHQPPALGRYLLFPALLWGSLQGAFISYGQKTKNMGNNIVGTPQVIWKI